MDADDRGPVPPSGRYRVRVIDVIRPRARPASGTAGPEPAEGAEGGALVEFEFSVGGPDLAVTLLLPLPAFREFCDRYGAEVSQADGRGGGRANLLGRNPGMTRAAGGRHDGGKP
jgi:hypothetical protein